MTWSRLSGRLSAAFCPGTVYCCSVQVHAHAHMCTQQVQPRTHRLEALAASRCRAPIGESGGVEARRGSQRPTVLLSPRARTHNPPTHDLIPWHDSASQPAYVTASCISIVLCLGLPLAVGSLDPRSTVAPTMQRSGSWHPRGQSFTQAVFMGFKLPLRFPVPAAWHDGGAGQRTPRLIRLYDGQMWTTPTRGGSGFPIEKGWSEKTMHGQRKRSPTIGIPSMCALYHNNNRFALQEPPGTPPGFVAAMPT